MFNLPNILTLGNLISGCIGIIMVLKGDPESGALWVWISVAFDFFDGFAARALNIRTEIGKELDSLADMVSFGVLPGMVVYELLKPVEIFDGAAYFAFLIPAFSALRLGKFNTDERQSDTFYGLPTPSNALFMTSLPFLEWSWIQNFYVLAAIVVIFCFLLISEMKMFALKFKSASFGPNKWKYLAIVMALAFVILFKVPGIAYVITGYILFSIVIHFSNEKSS